MKQGIVSIHYHAYRDIDGSVDIDNIDLQWMCTDSGFYKETKPLRSKQPLRYNSDNFLSDELRDGTEIEDFLSEEHKDLEKEGLFHTVLKFKLDWYRSPDTPDSPGEWDCEIDLEKVSTETITTDVEEVDKFFEVYNEERKQTEIKSWGTESLR